MISFPYIFFLSAHMPPLFGDYQTSLPFIHSNKTSPRLDLIDYQPITKKKKKNHPGINSQDEHAFSLLAAITYDLIWWGWNKVNFRKHFLIPHGACYGYQPGFHFPFRCLEIQIKSSRPHLGTSTFRLGDI